MTSERTAAVVSDLEKISGDVRSAFGGLDGEQLNRKADEKSWSVAQCLEHLIVINSLYFPLFEKMRTAGVVTSMWERISPLSGFFGRLLIKSLGPENPKKMRTSKKAYPSSSAIGANIVERFVEHNRELAEHVARISPDVDPRRIITSPLAGFVTYSLDDCLTILVVHERRHVLQAKRVVEMF